MNSAYKQKIANSTKRLIEELYKKDITIEYIPQNTIGNKDNCFLLKQDNNYTFIKDEEQDNVLISYFISYVTNEKELVTKYNAKQAKALINTYKTIREWLEDYSDIPLYKALLYKGQEQEYETKKAQLNELLTECALPARSNKDGFYENEKIEKIKELAEGKSIKPIYEDNYCVVFGGPGSNKTTPTLISSHADIVKGINEPSTRLEDDMFIGTYDNLGTNVAALSLVLEGLPENTFVAFTAEEEAGSCLGAISAGKFVTKECNRKPFFVGLDVTYEDMNKLISVEGISFKKKNKAITKETFSNYFDNQPNSNYIAVSKLNTKKDNFILDEDNYSEDLALFDEGIFMGNRYSAVSLCLPGDGNMHSDTGFKVKGPTFVGYIDNLKQFIYSLNLTKEQIAEKYPNMQTFNDFLCYKNAKINEREYAFNKVQYSSRFYSMGNQISMFDEAYDEIDWNTLDEENYEYDGEVFDPNDYENLIQNELERIYAMTSTESEFIDEAMISLDGFVDEDYLIDYYEQGLGY